MPTATIATLRRQREANTAYGNVKRMIYKLCLEHANRYGGNIDDLVSIGNEGYTKARRSHCEDQAAFVTWCWMCVKQALGIELRRQINAARRGRTINIPTELWSTVPTRVFNVENFSGLLGNDAIMVMKLVLDTPAEMEQAIQTKGGKPRNYRSTIKGYLRGIGWTAARITESFAEIKAVL